MAGGWAVTAGGCLPWPSRWIKFNTTELLLKDEDDGDGGLANQCYFVPLYFCFSFTSPLFLLFFVCLLFIYFFISLVPSVSLCIICVSSFFVCDFLYYLFVVLPFCGFCLFILVSLGLYLLVGSTTYGKGKLKFPFVGGRSQVSMSSLCLCFFFGLTRVNPSDPWPDHLTGSMTESGFKTMSQTMFLPVVQLVFRPANKSCHIGLISKWLFSTRKISSTHECFF